MFGRGGCSARLVWPQSKDTVKEQCTKIQANFRLFFLMVRFGLAMVMEGGKGIAVLCR